MRYENVGAYMLYSLPLSAFNRTSHMYSRLLPVSTIILYRGLGIISLIHVHTCTLRALSTHLTQVIASSLHFSCLKDLVSSKHLHPPTCIIIHNPRVCVQKFGVDVKSIPPSLLHKIESQQPLTTLSTVCFLYSAICFYIFSSEKLNENATLW